MEEIEKLKQKFRVLNIIKSRTRTCNLLTLTYVFHHVQAASYTTTHGYDYGALFDKIDGDGSGSIDMSEFSVMGGLFFVNILLASKY